MTQPKSAAQIGYEAYRQTWANDAPSFPPWEELTGVYLHVQAAWKEAAGAIIAHCFLTEEHIKQTGP